MLTIESYLKMGLLKELESTDRKNKGRRYDRSGVAFLDCVIHG